MRYLLTHCPHCRTGFYVGEEESGEEKVKVVCPYCNLRYKDIWDVSRVKDVKYQWELYNGIYFPVKFSKGNELHLKVGSILLFSALSFFMIGMLSVFFTDRFSVVYQGIGLGGVIFSVFVVLGAINAYHGRSFVISLTGSIFAILNSVLWGGLNFVDDFILLKSSFFFLYLSLSLVLSSLALMFIIKNRKKFDYGY